MMCRYVAVVICWLCLLNQASAAVVTSVETDKAPGGALPGAAYNPSFPSGGPSNSDLIQGMAPSLQSVEGDFQRETSAGTAALTNGTVATFYGTQAADSDHTAYATGNSDQFVEYSLGGARDLTSIVIYGGWNDGGRDAQRYNVGTSVDGVTFTALGGIDVNPGIQGTDTTPISTRVAFTNDASSILAAGVTHIRIDFLAVENGYTGYTEIDVLGVPEPTALAMSGLGMASLFIMRRRS
jgi:hypothetical protein